MLGIYMFDLVCMKNFVYIWYICCLVKTLNQICCYIAKREQRNIVVLNVCENFKWFCLTWDKACTLEACAAQLCSRTHSAGLNPETSMVLIENVVGYVIAPDNSTKESSQLHIHGRRF